MITITTSNSVLTLEEKRKEIKSFTVEIRYYIFAFKLDWPLKTFQQLTLFFMPRKRLAYVLTHTI